MPTDKKMQGNQNSRYSISPNDAIVPDLTALDKRLWGRANGMAVRTAMDNAEAEGNLQKPTRDLNDEQRATIRALFINEVRDRQLGELLRRPPNDPERIEMLDYLQELSDEERSRFRDKYGLNRDYLLDEGLESPLAPLNMPIDELDDAFINSARKRGIGRPKFVEKLRALVAEFDNVSYPEKSIPLWSERIPGVNAAQFIRKNYGEDTSEGWRHNGTTRPDLKKNPGLYGAYTSWIGDHPDDKLEFAPGGGKLAGRPRKPNADENRRIRDKDRKARDREAARTTNLSQGPR